MVKLLKETVLYLVILKMRIKINNEQLIEEYVEFVYYKDKDGLLTAKFALPERFKEQMMKMSEHIIWEYEKVDETNNEE